MSRKATGLGKCRGPESCLPSSSQNVVESFTGDLSALGDNVLNLEEQKPWQWQKEELEKELYDCIKAHKMSILQSDYEMSKLQVSFVVMKRQESLAKEQLEDALGTVHKLQTKVDRLSNQLRHTEIENRRLKTAISTLISDFDKRTAENDSLQRALTAAKITSNTVKLVDVVEMLIEETVPFIAQHELQTEQLEKIESNLGTGKGLVTDQNILEKWILEDEAFHSANIQIDELKQKLALTEMLQSDLASTKLGLEEVTKEKDELLARLEAITQELLECKTSKAEIELHDAELSRYAQALNIEKLTLTGQLELLRGELAKQEEAARIAQIRANKAMEAEGDCAKALKLVQEKEEDIEHFINQLESLREKNSMLRIQLDMEQQCKEAEIAEMPNLHEQSRNLPSRNLNTSMELVASNSVQDPQKIPPKLTTLHVSEAVANAVETNKACNNYSGHEPCQRTSDKGKANSTTERRDETPNPNLDALQPSTNLPVKRSSRLRNRINTQHPMDSSSTATGTRKVLIDLEEYNDENDGVIEDVTQTKKRGASRLKRPPVLVPSEIETNKKKGRKSHLNTRRTMCPTTCNDTDVGLGPAHLLVRTSDTTPLRPNITPRTGRSKLPR